MPQQQFVLSYLIHPASYKEVGGAYIPFSFSIADKEGYVFNYSPFALWNGLKMNSILGERMQRSDDAMLPLEVRAERRIEQESLLQYYFPLASDNEARAGVNTYEFLLSDVVKEQNATVQFLLNYSLKARGYGEISGGLNSELIRKKWDADVNLMTEATSDRPQHESFIEKVSIGDEIVKLIDADIIEKMITTSRPHIAHESRIIENLVLSDTKGYKDSLKDHAQVYADEIARRIAMTAKELTADRGARTESLILEPVLAAKSLQRDSILRKTMVLIERQKYNTKVISKMLEMTRENKGMQVIQRVIDSVRDGKGTSIVRKVISSVKDGKGSYKKDHIKFSVKDGKGASMAARNILALLVEVELLGENHKLVNAERYEKHGYLMDERILSVFHTPEAFIEKTLRFMDKVGVVAGFLGAIEADVKNPRESFITKILHNFDRGYHQGEWIEKTIFAVASGHQAFIDRLIELGDDIGKDTIVHLLKECDIPDREGLVQEIYQAWNENKENRPAGTMRVSPLATWDMGFDDLFDTWDKGWDYLDPPSKDYNYEKHKAEIYDSNGVPLDPAGPMNLPDVEVKMPVNHPTPEYAEVGSKEAWVELYTFQDVTMMIATDWKRNMARYAEMSGHDALKDSLKKLYDLLQEQTNWDDEYQRMFRYVRWQAERIAHQDSVTVLHRTYDDWRDRIIANGGVFTYPHEANQFRVQSTGTIESSSTVGSLSFELENYIDGTITFSSIISTGSQSSTSVLRFYIDEELVQTFTAADGVNRLSFEVPMGVHQYRWEYEAEVGDTVKLSGIQVSGVQFIEAVTTQKDAGSLRGVAAVNHLVQALLTYYGTHHKGKSKGAMGVYQRKIWLS